ncbi:pentapeptide repeat-containing protein [uncultured Nostoc sp.]|uniref:pentapeptide repeat-containing protein n=1 Tax=uncultured Nostoc sp. TaxID=340711 RepID=UPI0035CB1578
MTQDYSGQNLRGRNFKGRKDLAGANFSYADIRGANFSNANLTGTNFSHAKAGVQLHSVIYLVIPPFILSVGSGFLWAVNAHVVSQIFSSGSYTQIGSRTVLTILIVIVSSFFTIRQEVVAGLGAVAVTVTAALAVGVIAAGTIAGDVAGVVAIAGTVAGVEALAFAGAFAVAGVRGVVFAVAGAIAFAGVRARVRGVVFAVAGTLLSIYIPWQAMKGNEKYSLVRNIAITFAARGGTSFHGADLTGADFTQATLKSTDFRKANLTRTCWRNAKQLDRVRLGQTYLQNAEVCQLLVTGEGQGKKFDRQDLQGVNLHRANLAHASFINTDLSQANLQGANLFEAKLVQTNLDQANLNNACLTGAYIEDWGITRKTRLDNVKCKYIYLKLPRAGDRDPNRMPPPEQGDFGENDFNIFITSVLDTLDLYHKQDINAGLAVTVLKGLTLDYPVQFELVGLEKRGNDQFLIRLKVFGQASHFQLQREYYARYEQTLPLYDPKKLMPDTEAIVEEMIKTVKENPGTRIENLHNQGIVITGGSVSMTGDRNVNTGGDYYEQSGNLGIGHMSGGEIKEGAKVAGTMNEAERQNLAQAAAEIQQLLKQLEQTYPTTTTSQQMVVAAEAINRIESNPLLKERVINAVKSGGLAAFEKAIDNPAGAFIVGAIKGWQEVEAED